MSLKLAWEGLLNQDNSKRNTLETDGGVNFDDRKVFHATDNLTLYKKFGFLKNIVNAVADDGTREWLKFKINNELNDDVKTEISKALVKRGEDFHLQNKTRNLIKYSRIYKEGAAFEYGIDGGAKNTAETILLDTAIPTSIDKVEFINLIDDPDLFSVTSRNISDPNRKDFKAPSFQVSGMNIHPSRIAWLVNEYDSQLEEGISLVDVVIDGVRAQTAGLKGSTHILERLGAILFKSKANDLGENSATTISEILAVMKSNLKSSGVFGLLPDDDVTLLNFTFAGVKDVFDNVMDNLSGLSKVPRMVILGARGGGIITGDGAEAEVESYFRDVGSFMSIQVTPILRKTFDLFLIEKDTDLIKLLKTHNVTELDYEIEYNSLFQLNDKSAADIRKTNSESDEIDFKAGKVTGDELRDLDDRYSGLPTMETVNDEDEDEELDELIKEGDAKIEDELDTEHNSGHKDEGD